MQMAAFLRQLAGACQTDALGSARDEGELAAQIQIHVDLPGVIVSPVTGDRDRTAYQRSKYSYIRTSPAKKSRVKRPK
jgi:hypothetical protein